MNVSKKDRFKLAVAVYLILYKSNEVLLLRRANTGFQDGKYSFIAGHLESDELATSGLVREAREEAGIVVDANHLRLAHTCHRLNRDEVEESRIDLFFEAKKWEGIIINAEPDKCDDLSWFPLNNLPSNMMPLAKHVVDCIAKDRKFSEFSVGPI